MSRVVVEVKGGLVTSVVTDLPWVEVYVVDRDIDERSEPGDWPGGAEVKAVGGLMDAPSDPVQVAALLGEIAAECEYCQGAGYDAETLLETCQECEGRGWWLPYAEPEIAREETPQPTP